MRRAAGVGIVLAIVFFMSVPAAAQMCLHDTNERRAQQNRRVAALIAVRALAAAEVVAALQGHPPPDLPDGAAAWVSQHAAVDGSTLAALALTAIARTRANSELAELWEETDEAAAWGAVVDGLVSRIQAAQ